MKKYTILCAGMCLAMLFTGCKSKDSAYKQAYEKAKAAEAAQYGTARQSETAAVTETPVVTPVQTVTYNDAKVVDNTDNVAVRQERVSLVSGAGLRGYSVVVGSFHVITNAEGRQQELKNAGYAAQIVKNEQGDMYRVIATTFDDKASAVKSRDQLRAKYDGAWLLYNVK